MKIFFSLVLLVAALFSSVDMNNANESELQTLKGIGPSKAKAIITYRDVHGCFVKLGDFTKVKGIGSKTLEKNREELVLGKCKK